MASNYRHKEEGEMRSDRNEEEQEWGRAGMEKSRNGEEEESEGEESEGEESEGRKGKRRKGKRRKGKKGKTFRHIYSLDDSAQRNIIYV